MVLLLFALAAVLLVKSHVLSASHLTSGRTASLWAFLGVALGAVVTLISALLTEQNNRRTETLARDAEHRMKIDTVAKVLELVTEANSYAPRARVNGAIATLMELGGGPVGLRILGELWAAKAVACDTAVWLINRVLQDSTSSQDEIMEAVSLLAFRADRLVPMADDPEQNWYEWPPALRIHSGFATLPDDAKGAVLLAAARMLLAREIAFWKQFPDNPVPIVVLVNAIDDRQYRPDPAAAMLKTLLDVGALDTIGFQVGEELARRIQKQGDGWTFDPSPWFNHLIAQFGPWARGERNELPQVTVNVPVPERPST